MRLYPSDCSYFPEDDNHAVITLTLPTRFKAECQITDGVAEGSPFLRSRATDGMYNVTVCTLSLSH
jgi:hypothetical protein